MKYKTHKLLQVGAIVILCLAIYVSIKQVEGFQATDMPNYATLDELVNSVNGSWSSSKPIWRTPEFADKERQIKFSMDNSYREYTTLMNEAFAKSKVAGDRYDVTIDKLYTVTTNNYVSKASVPEEFKMTMGFLFMHASSIYSGKPSPLLATANIPKWWINLQEKCEILLKAMETKIGVKIDEEPPPDKLKIVQPIMDELQKIEANIFNASKSLPERDDETAAKVLNAQIEFIENYRMPVAPSAATPSAATPSAATPSSSSNTNMYIGIGVGSVVLIGIIAFFIFSANAADPAAPAAPPLVPAGSS